MARSSVELCHLIRCGCSSRLGAASRNGYNRSVDVHTLLTLPKGEMWLTADVCVARQGGV
eukprot:5530967-Amphidinium_carterae.1